MYKFYNENWLKDSCVRYDLPRGGTDSNWIWTKIETQQSNNVYELGASSLFHLPINGWCSKEHKNVRLSRRRMIEYSGRRGDTQKKITTQGQRKYFKPRAPVGYLSNKSMEKNSPKSYLFYIISENKNKSIVLWQNELTRFSEHPYY